MSERLTVVPAGARELRDLLFEQGVEFPCGGLANCGGCRVRVVEGEVPIDDEMRATLSETELAGGWRLGCRARAAGRVVLEIGLWQSPILTDEAALDFEPGEGLGVAVDVGTTTLVVQAVNLATGEVHSVRTALNPQAAWGADVMTRIEFELREPGVLRAALRRKLGEMIADALEGAPAREILLAGNTVMHHLFCGCGVEPLSHAPFVTPHTGARRFTAAELGWTAAGEVAAEFLPSIGGFVGSDIAAGMVAVGMLERPALCALMDLGTNGEIVVGSREAAICASTAAGPAFEAGKISMGMRAVAGAIDHVTARSGSLQCHVLGGVEARGICGSGLVDAAAAGLETGAVQASGRLRDRGPLPLAGAVRLTQRDIRELQLAKGAVAAGFEMLAGDRPVARLHLAGAFGNYVDAKSARRIGLIRPAPESVLAAGNTALRGTRLLLLNRSRREQLIGAVLARTRHVPLAENPEFMDRFAANLAFPE